MLNNGNNINKKKNANKIKNFIGVILIIAEIITLIALIKLYPIYEVFGYSMYPTLKPGDKIIASSLKKINKESKIIKRGDIVIIKLPSEDHDFVKRVVAVGGDTIQIKKGIVYVNGQRVKQYDTILDRKENMPAIIIPKGYIYVMGDNRPISYDSRIFGPIPQNYVISKVLFIFYPLKDKKILGGD